MMSDVFWSASSDEASLHSLSSSDRTLSCEEVMEESASQQPVAFPGVAAPAGSMANPDKVPMTIPTGSNDDFAAVDWGMMIDVNTTDDDEDVAYLDLARNHMAQVTASSIACAVEAENPTEVLPIDLTPIYGTGSCRLIFESRGPETGQCKTSCQFSMSR